MAYLLRFAEPQKVGCIVKLKKRCGDKKCGCYTKNKRHTSYGLKYREFDKKRGSIVQRMTYVKASDVSQILKQLYQTKGEELLWKIGDESVINLANTYPNLTQAELHRKTYELYGMRKPTIHPSEVN